MKLQELFETIKSIESKLRRFSHCIDYQDCPTVDSFPGSHSEMIEVVWDGPKMTKGMKNGLIKNGYLDRNGQRYK